MNRREIVLGAAACIIPLPVFAQDLLEPWFHGSPVNKRVPEDPRIIVFTTLKEAVENTYDIYTHSRVWLSLYRLKREGIFLDFYVGSRYDIPNTSYDFAAWVKYQKQIIQYSFLNEETFIVVPDPDWHPWFKTQEILPEGI